MKNLHFLVVAGCLVFSQAQAETAYQNAQTKSQAQGQYLSAFWKEAQTSHAFVEAFYDVTPKLVMGQYANTTRLENLQNDKNTRHDADQTAVMESPERPSMPANLGS